MRGEILEFSDICKKYLGKPGELLAILFSLAATAGAAIVFWVLMSNFLYNSGKYIHGKILLPLHIHTCAFIYGQQGSIWALQLGHYIQMCHFLLQLSG